MADFGVRIRQEEEDEDVLVTHNCSVWRQHEEETRQVDEGIDGEVGIHGEW